MSRPTEKVPFRSLQLLTGVTETIWVQPGVYNEEEKYPTANFSAESNVTIQLYFDVLTFTCCMFANK